MLPQNIYSAFSSAFPGMAVKMWKENTTLAVILLSRKTQPEFWPPECRRSSDGVSGTFKDC